MSRSAWTPLQRAARGSRHERPLSLRPMHPSLACSLEDAALLADTRGAWARKQPPRTRGTPRQPGLGAVLVQGLALAGAVAVAGLTMDSARWNLSRLLVIAVFAIVSLRHRRRDRQQDPRLRRAAGPDARHGATRRRPGGGCRSRHDVGCLASTSLPAAGVDEQPRGVHVVPARSAASSSTATTRWLSIDPNSAAYYLLVFATFIVALAVNFFCICGYQCYRPALLAASTRARPSLPAPVGPAFLRAADDGRRSGSR